MQASETRQPKSCNSSKSTDPVPKGQRRPLWRRAHRTCLDGDASRLVNSGLKPAVKDAVQLQVEVLVQFITSSWLYQNDRSFGSAVMIPPLHYIQMSPSFEREIVGRDVDAGARLRTQVSVAELQEACRSRMQPLNQIFERRPSGSWH